MMGRNGTIVTHRLEFNKGRLLYTFGIRWDTVEEGKYLSTLQAFTVVYKALPCTYHWSLLVLSSQPTAVAQFNAS